MIIIGLVCQNEGVRAKAVQFIEEWFANRGQSLRIYERAAIPGTDKWTEDAVLFKNIDSYKAAYLMSRAWPKEGKIIFISPSPGDPIPDDLQQIRGKSHWICIHNNQEKLLLYSLDCALQTHVTGKRAARNDVPSVLHLQNNN